MLSVRGEMIQSVVRRKIFHANVRYLSIFVTNHTDVSMRKQCFPAKSNMSHTVLDFRINPIRRYCDEAHIRLPKLLDEPVILKPSFSQMLKNFFTTMFTITPYIDRDFNVDEFKKGALHAILIVSNALANQNYDLLNGLVTDNVLNKLKNSVNNLSPEQRKLIAVKEEDVASIYVHEVKADNQDPREQLITVTIVILYLPSGRQKMQEILNESKSIMKLINYHLEHILFLNYRFVRKYVDGKGGPWIINMANHFSEQ